MEEQRRQVNYTIAEEFRLPSNGEIYAVPVDPVIELRSMTARDEMKRLAPAKSQYKTLADIIEGCMLEKPAIHVYDMAIADYVYLLQKLRVVTYGPKYKMAASCPHCLNAVEAEANLDELEVVPIDIEKFNQLTSIELPKSGAVVTLKVQTPHMLDTIEYKVKELKRKFKDSEIQFDLLVQLEEMIDTVNGAKLNPLEAETFINKLQAADLMKLLNSIEELENSFGLQLQILADCPLCGGEIKTFFRMGPEFFRPTTV